MKHGLLWLALRLMRKQKPRTAAVFCGILFSSLLLDLFGSLGYYFWSQVHKGDSGDTVYDSTQFILTALACIMLLLVAACAITLLHNMFLLSFAQKWRSLSRLAALGASRGAVLFLVMAELCILYGLAAPFGKVLSYFVSVLVIGSPQMPLWMLAGIYSWLFVVSCICGMRPAMGAIREGSHRKALPPPPCDGANSKQCIDRYFRNAVPGFSGKHTFASFMAKKYYMANRKHYHRISLTFIAAMILYVPASYLIHANMQEQQSDLHTKYGIQYSYAPSSREELESSIKEYQHLANAASPGGSMLCVELHGIASIEAELLNEKLLDALREAGWQGGGQLIADSVLYVVEDAYYDAWSGIRHNNIWNDVRHNAWSGIHHNVWSDIGHDTWSDIGHDTWSGIGHDTWSGIGHDTWSDIGYDTWGACLDACPDVDSGTYMQADSMAKPSVPYKAILVDRYINRSRWNESADTLYLETPLLKADAKDGINSSQASGAQPGDAIKVYYGLKEGFLSDMDYGQPDPMPYICPNACADGLPDGIGFTGNISIVLPLRQLPGICGNMQSYGNVRVSGYFGDDDETLFDVLAQRLGEKGMGRLIYSRRDYRQWYDSMHGIRVAMTAISAVLFLIGLLNMFSTLVFQYLERKHSLAVLWSLGQAKYGLLKILALESMQSFVHAMFIGIPASCALCYMVYRVYRKIWQIGFTLPFGQIALVVAAAFLSGVTAITVSFFLMKSQDFQSAWMDE